MNCVKILKRLKTSRAVARKSRYSFIVNSLVSITKTFRKKNFAGSFGFSKSQRKWGRRSAREKSANENCRCGNVCSYNGNLELSCFFVLKRDMKISQVTFTKRNLCVHKILPQLIRYKFQLVLTFIYGFVNTYPNSINNFCFSFLQQFHRL